MVDVKTDKDEVVESPGCVTTFYRVYQIWPDKAPEVQSVKMKLCPGSWMAQDRIAAWGMHKVFPVGRDPGARSPLDAVYQWVEEQEEHASKLDIQAARIRKTIERYKNTLLESARRER